MIVHSNHKGPKILGAIKRRGKDGTLTGSSKPVVLKPGMNRDVPDDVWEHYRATSGIQAEIAAGLLSAGDTDPDDLLASDEKIAMALIAEQPSAPILRQWLKVERRPQIRSALQARIATFPEAHEEPKAPREPKPPADKK